MILVTGATGLVGGNLIWHLLQENDRVSAIWRDTSNTENLRTIFSFYTSNVDEFLSCIDWVVADVLDYESIAKAMNNITVIYHCAAVVSLGKSTNQLTETNISGTQNIVHAALAKKNIKLCFVSSIAACGKAENGTLSDENTTWTDSESRSEYAKSKYFSEQIVWKAIENGLNAVIVNPGVILGVSANNAGSAKLFEQVRKGLIFYTNGGSGYVDVQDVVKVMIQLTNSSISGERFILVAENCSNKDILRWMADGFGKIRPFIGIGKKSLMCIGYLSEIMGELFHFSPLIDRGMAKSAINREYYSNEKIQNQLNFQFEPIKDSILAICNFLQKKD